jgi:tetratricopeptide (TPR) repeat protein
MKNENRSRTRITTSLVTLCSLLLLSGCASFQVAGEVQTGRQALLAEKPDVALVHFQRAAQLDPDYLLNLAIYPQGVWTYVGRSYYDLGKFSEARQALERARSRYEQDSLARLYLGLILVQQGDRQKGLKECEAGLGGLRDWLDYIAQNHPDGQFWDPGRDLRSAIQENLAMTSGRDINWPQAIASMQGLGKRFEEEIELARRDKEIFTSLEDDND